MKQTRFNQFRGQPGRGGALRRAAAFTLVEVMVSLALVLMIVLGVSQVFRMSTDATTASQALSTIARDHRAALPTFAEDFRNCVPDSPAFIISSRVAAPGATPGQPNGGFRNNAEQANDLDGDPGTSDVNGATFNIPVASLNDGIPRLDTLAFLRQGVQRRQTGPASSVVSTMTSSESFVWFGHLYTVRREGTSLVARSPEGTYAADRVLGRMAVLLKDPSAIPSSEPYFPVQSGSAAIKLPPLGIPTTSGPASGSPFTHSSDTGNGYNRTLLGARYDLAGTTIEQFRLMVNDAYVAQPWLWHQSLVGDVTGVPAVPNSGNMPVGSRQLYRFFCQPQIRRPITSEKLAYTAPVFIEHCTQFIVEYAGDYLKQDEASGNIASIGVYMNGNTRVVGETDGKVDFAYVGGIRKVRWYGLPRNTNGSLVINRDRDVVPFADVISGRAGAPGNARAPWEMELPPSASNFDYMIQRGTGAARQYRYVCAFRNDAPMMIRILMKIDDPSNKLQDGQWYEYVFSRQ